MFNPTFSACTTVLGNPSRRNPFLHSGLSRLLSIMSTTRSSDTSFPSSITFFSCPPSFDPEAISALSMSPVDKWQTQNFSFSRGACKARNYIITSSCSRGRFLCLIWHSYPTGESRNYLNIQPRRLQEHSFLDKF